MDLAPGAQCPAFELTAAVSERTLSPATFAGKCGVLVFHGPKTTDAPKDVGKAVRAAHPSAENVLVANIIDLRSMQGLWQKVAKASMKSTYDKLAPKIEGDPADYIMLGPDWDGAAANAFGIEDPNANAAVVVLKPDGAVHAVIVEGALGEQTVAALTTIK